MQIPGQLSDTTLGDVLGALVRAQVTGLVRLREPMGHGVDREHRIFLSRGEVVAVETDAKVPVLGEILMQHGLLDATAQRRLRQRFGAGARQPVGELLVQEGYVSRDVIGAALRKQLRSKLDALFLVRQATLSFHVACVAPPNATSPLAPRDFLRGRPRARDRMGKPQPNFAARSRYAAGGGAGARGENGASRDPRGEGGPRGQHAEGGAGNWNGAAGQGASRANGPRRDPPRDSSMPFSAAHKRSEALALLGLSEGATLTEVKKTFRHWAVKLHPDRHVHATDAERDAMARRFAAMSAAYHVVVG